MVAKFDVNDCVACTNGAGAILFLGIVIAINAEGVLTCRTLVQVPASNNEVLVAGIQVGIILPPELIMGHDVL